MANIPERTEVIDWLMQGDPAIQWQTMRDLLGEPQSKWKSVRQRVAKQGWGAELLARRDSAGTWGGGIYLPKWKSTNYTLLLLRDMGLTRGNRAGRCGAGLLLDEGLGRIALKDFPDQLERLDLCIKGMYLGLSVYFGARDARTQRLVEQILSEQMDDGGWNCAQQQHEVRHGSLHTTINVLEGLADYAQYRGDKADGAVGQAMSLAQEFMLQHRLFRSDKTGQVIHEAFTKFSFPPRWHWDVLRGLDYFRRVDAPRDPRLQDAIDLLLSKRCADGRWKLENHHKGMEFFCLEKSGQPSRWNTLRALRVLRWWG